jgi:prepilin-type N-terminal cleavage/methylation domain-containing protein
MNCPDTRELRIHEAGLSLVEVLVAVVLIAVGALNAASVQRAGLIENQRTYSRQVAASLARPASGVGQWRLL